MCTSAVHYMVVVSEKSGAFICSFDSGADRSNKTNDFYRILGSLWRRALVRPSGLISPTASRERLVSVGPTSS